MSSSRAKGLKQSPLLLKIFTHKTLHLSSFKMEGSYFDVRLLKYKPWYDIWQYDYFKSAYFRAVLKLTKDLYNYITPKLYILLYFVLELFPIYIYIHTHTHTGSAKKMYTHFNERKLYVA
jgi:hypothetical protein